MSLSSDDPLVRYLLGRASEEERSDIEERLFVEDGFEEQLHATADDVMDDFLAGRLAPADRSFFEARFLSVPRHRERLAFLARLRKTVARPQARRPWAAWAAAAAVTAALLGGSWALFTGRPATGPAAPPQVAAVATPAPAASPEPKDPAPAVEPRRVAERPASAAPEPRPAATPADEAPGDIRAVRLAQHDGPAPVVDVPLGARTKRIHFQLDVDADTPSFDAVIRTADGREVWRQSGLTPPAGDPLSIEVPAGLLEQARYALVIESEGRRDRNGPRTLEFTLRIVREP